MRHLLLDRASAANIGEHRKARCSPADCIIKMPQLKQPKGAYFFLRNLCVDATFDPAAG